MCGFLRTERGRRRLDGRNTARPIVWAEGLKGRGRQLFFDQSGVDAWRPGRVGRVRVRQRCGGSPRGQRGPDGFRGHPGCLPGTRLPRQRALPVVAAPAGLSRQPRGPPLPPPAAGGCACAVAPRGMLGVVVLGGEGEEVAPWRRSAGRAAITGPGGGLVMASAPPLLPHAALRGQCSWGSQSPRVTEKTKNKHKQTK